MSKLLRVGAVKLAIILLLLNLWSLPCGASVAGDISAGLPYEKVIANGLAAGLTIETILAQAVDAGAEICPLIKAALAQGADMARIFKALADKAQADPRFVAECSPCLMMKCAVDAGRDVVEVANAMMAAEGELDQVRTCLAGLGYPGSETYTYTPPGPPIGPNPTFPGGGGGVASPAS
jgi:hypothetical protein